ncbi:hypothetical protein FA13DRAFT_1787316 [Coprinellus micaceus]|uniref:F-box domain-containing protein n=1 Tax=Coprinellus micaceus TaxID=71717 RepID=A0A4Y7TTW5_COPMI|nr:hypothetical protein FA13DRAFT_1787316 [Coprinellus micaceus]
MEDPWPFTQHLDANYVPTSQELDEFEALVAEREAIIDAIDAGMVELERVRTANAQYVRRLRTLGAPVRRLPDDIVLAIFESLVIGEPWSTPHPSVVASHVCRRWTGLALGTPLLWTKIEIRLLLDGLWGKVPQIANENTGAPDGGMKIDYVEPCAPPQNLAAPTVHKGFRTRVGNPTDRL